MQVLQPEFPGLIAASVCSAFINELSPLPLPVVTARFLELIIPAVTVPDKPSGEPIAITASPTWTISLSPSCRVGAPTTSIFKTAKSYELSLPIVFVFHKTNIFPLVLIPTRLRLLLLKGRYVSELSYPIS